MYFVILPMLTLMLLTLSLFQMKFSKVNYKFLKEQSTAFECGFDQFDKKYLGFCVQFIKTAFLFLMVDLEIALLLPLFVNSPLYEGGYLSSLAMMAFVLITLLLMLLMEVLLGGLSWREDF